MIQRREFCAALAGGVLAGGILASTVGCTPKPDPRKKGFVLKACAFAANYKKKKLSRVNPTTTVGSLCRGSLDVVMFLAMIEAAFRVPKHCNVAKDLRPNVHRTAQLGDITMLELGQWLEKNAQDDVAWQSFTKAINGKKK